MALCLFPLRLVPGSPALSPPSFPPPFVQLRVLYLFKENTSYLAIIVDCTERCKNNRASPRDRALRFPRLVSHNESTATKPGARRTQDVSNPVSSSPSSFKALLFVNVYSILGVHNLLKQHTPSIFIIPERSPLSSPSAHSHGIPLDLGPSASHVHGGMESLEPGVLTSPATLGRALTHLISFSLYLFSFNK